jgi:hypothetical protein
VSSTADVVEVGVRLQFAEAGRVVLGEDDRPRFPPLPASAAIYRLDLSGDGGQRVYLGETYNMRRRGSHYRNPGATQQTSIRINGLLVRHLVAGGSVSISVAEAAAIVRGGVSIALDLTTKAARVLAEHAALVAAKLDGDDVLNL